MKNRKKPTVLDYKVGYHSYQVLSFLLIGNIALNLVFDFQWAETVEIEYFMILIASISVTMIISIYNQALHQTSPLFEFYAFGRILLGIYFIYQSFVYESPFVVNGLATISAATFLLGLMFIVFALTEYVRLLVDKIKGTQN
ncbi:MAG: hypothetical protein JJU01_09975 [Alkalibacterium sp.]|nr:hypothetical protein [Alkalibacterium sp.]